MPCFLPDDDDPRSTIAAPPGFWPEPELVVLERLRHQKLGVLTEREAALVLGRSEAALVALRKAGRSPAFIDAGRCIFYRVEALRVWLVALERAAGTPRATEGAR